MRTLAVLSSALLLLTGCSYSNSTNSQASPPISRLETDPPGAALFLVERNLSLRTPADLNYDIDEDEEIEVSKPGFETWRGTLGEVTRVSNNTRKLVLRPIR
ncbi:MAG: hypothetical protein IPM29_27630 [Planctomycetes bacterium]|nr:hypothetical protein [Planctomycetota bacterium]